MKLIQLTRGQFTVVDDEDFDYLVKWNWYALKAKHGFYAVRNGPRPAPGKRQTMILMHRVILARKLGIDSSEISETDHEDGNKLNNQRFNLHNVTSAENLQGFRTKWKGSRSQYRGVSWNKNDKRWQAVVTANGKRHYGGQYETEEEAARVRDRLALEVTGKRASLNFP